MDRLMKYYFRKLCNGNIPEKIHINSKHLYELKRYLSYVCPRSPGEKNKILGMEIVGE